MPQATTETTIESRLDQLEASRNRDRFLWISAFIFGGFVIWAFLALASDVPDLIEALGGRNAQRFFDELVPYPVRQSDSWADLGPWAAELFAEHGASAVTGTFGIATIGIMIAAAAAALISPIAASTLATAHPYGLFHGNSPAPIRVGWGIVRGISRALFLLTRAIPEYIYAFLLLSIFGPSLWALILALAIHNIGILGRLGSEVIENFPAGTSSAQMMVGGTRTQAVVSAIFPASLNRVLVYFFYRWETCVREATVLGLVGIPSLGLLIDEARARLYYDEMFFFVLLGAALVFAGDITSNIVRTRLREAA
ncbi:PhnE/PtxC family ABC transporter permease [Sulfuriroseicoccus oceanibius]|uniref:ABC transporter permease subunit n=1 Tax=Sulfuriroseicoccus oceanibius TaxID=2707525 RepID=A0A6B3L0G2_9BACT|nr:ABC transporter permease subunit [Sulfuriroseicoccus oceanibius]QQL43861.1 ABC transporter permease subunit [Sulfuriroseicoccus oceanibius]